MTDDVPTPGRFVDNALWYLKHGRRPIPIKPNSKAPLVNWKTYGERPPTVEEIRQWGKTFGPNTNIAILTGAPSGLDCLDIDRGSPDPQDWLPPGCALPGECLVRTPHNGYHRYFKTIEGARISHSKLAPKTDYLTSGSYALVPGSIIDGRPYVFVRGFRTLADAHEVEAPQWFKDRVLNGRQPGWKLPTKQPAIEQDIPDGKRKATLTFLAGTMRNRGMTEEAILQALLAENAKRCKPPLEEAEVKDVAHSSGKWAPGTGTGDTPGGQVTQGELLTQQCEQRAVEFLQDERGKPHVCLPIGAHHELWPTSNERFRTWQAREYRKEYGKPPSREALYQAKEQVDAMCYEKPRRTLYNRVGKHDGRIIYDLTDDQWRAVVISSGRWEISSLPPVFRRLRHQLPQVEPKSGGDACKLLEFCNISEDDQCLFLVSVASWLVPDIPHPIIVLHGEPGSGKSTTARVVKQLIDPSAAQSLRAPRDEESADHVLFNHWVASFDNVSHISEWFSDMLCRAITGGASSQRKLYTNEEDIPRAYRRCVLINGIGNPAVRADLLDRAVVIETEPLSTVVDEEEFSARWTSALPEILGGLLDSLAQAMGDVDTVQRPGLPRMADFVRWGLALAPPLGYSGDEFFDAYRAALDAKWRDAVANDAFADAILGIVKGTEKRLWEGTARDLLEALPGSLRESRAKKWTASTVGREISRLAPALRKLGLSVEKQHSKQGRKIVLSLSGEATEEDDATLPF